MKSSSSNTRLFRYNSERVPEEDDVVDGKRVAWLKKVGLDRFFGGIIKLGAVFSRQALNKEHGVRANLAPSLSVLAQSEAPPGN